MLTAQPNDIVLTELLDALPDAVIWLRAIRDQANQVINFKIEYANQKAQEMAKGVYRVSIGTPVLGDSGHEPAESEKTFRDLCTILETGQPQEFNYFNEKLSSWLLVNRAKSGDGVLSVTRNISALKAAEQTNRDESRKTQQALEQSAEQLRTVIDSARVGIYLIHPVWNETAQIVDFRFRMANQMLASYAGQEADVLIGELVSNWFPAYLQNGLFKRYVVIYETAQTQHFNFHYNTDKVDFWISITATKLGDDVLVTFSDYTDIKKLQQRLEASATELQTIIDTSQTGIFLLSPVRDQAGEVVDFRFRVANRQLASYVGQEPEAVVGALGSQWFPDYKTNGLFEAYCKTYATGNPQRFDFHYEGSGIDVWLDIMATKLGDEILVTFGDYTPLKKLQQQLEKSVVSLQRSNKNLEQFAYVASHDLQEPLRKIQAFGDILQSQYASTIDEGGADIIQRMQSAASRMQILIKDVLAYSRIATRRETIGPVDLSQLVDDVLTDIETAVSDKRASIGVGPLPIISRADSAQLRQLFQNLISNALKFTRTDPSAPSPAITITAQPVFGRDIPGLVVAPTDADQLFHLIEITDNGIGFDPRQAERIFQVFQRLHNRSEYQGTGIGLAIVQKVIENHHGYIQAEGRPGEGATFRVALPA